MKAMGHDEWESKETADREPGSPYSGYHDHFDHDHFDILMMGEKKQEGSKIMEQKVYKVMKGAGAANIAVGVIQLVVGLVTGIVLIITGAKLIAGKSKILF